MSNIKAEQRTILRGNKKVLPTYAEIAIEASVSIATVTNVFAGVSQNSDVLAALYRLSSHLDLPDHLQKFLSQHKSKP